MRNNSGFGGAYGLYEHVFDAVKGEAAKLGKVQEPELTVLRGLGRLQFRCTEVLRIWLQPWGAM